MVNRSKEASLNVVFITNCYPLITLTFITNQIKGLLDSGHSVSIISMQKPEPAVLNIVNLDGRIKKSIYYLDDFKAGRISSLFKTLNFCIKHPSAIPLLFKYYLKEDKIPFASVLLFTRFSNADILHAHFGPSGMAATELIKRGFFNKAGFITTFHGYDLKKQEFDNNYYTPLFNTCQFYTVNSRFSFQHLKDLGCDKENIFLLPVGLDTSLFQKKLKNKPENKFHLLFVGRLTAFKGPDRAIEIFQILHSKYHGKFKLTIIGDGDMLNQLQLMVDDLGVQEYVDILGACSQSKIIDLMETADIFIYPAKPADGREENQGLVIQEAQSMELPVVVFDVGGITDGIVDGETGFALPYENLDSFAIIIEKLFLDYSLRKRIGKNARGFVHDHFDTVVLNDRLLEIYHLSRIAVSKNKAA